MIDEQGSSDLDNVLLDELSSLQTTVKSELGNVNRRVDDLNTRIGNGSVLLESFADNLASIKKVNDEQELSIHQSQVTIDKILERLTPPKIEGIEREPSLEEDRNTLKVVNRYLFEKSQGVGGRCGSEVIDELSRYEFGKFFQTELPALLLLMETYNREKLERETRDKEIKKQAEAKERSRNFILGIILSFFTGIVGFVYNGTVKREVADATNSLEGQIEAVSNSINKDLIENYVKLTTTQAAFDRIDANESWIDQNRKVIDALKLTVEVPE